MLNRTQELHRHGPAARNPLSIRMQLEAGATRVFPTLYFHPLGEGALLPIPKNAGDLLSCQAPIDWGVLFREPETTGY